MPPLDANGNLTYVGASADPPLPGVPSSASVPRKKGWATSGVLTTNGASSLSLQADFHDSGIYTIQFGIIAAPTQIYAAIAEISWTVEGNTITRRINVANGTSISGGGQAVSIKLRDDSVPLIITPDQNGTYNVAISITPGARATSSVPPILKGAVSTFDVAPGGNFSLAVPQDAGIRSVQCLVTVDTPGTKQATLIQGNVAGSELAESDASIPDFVPLVPGCNVLIFENTSATLNETVTILFGIDG